MKLFSCQSCGSHVYFTDTHCVTCGHSLGYIPEKFDVTALEPTADALKALVDGKSYVYCENARHNTCNWLVQTGGLALCPACRHNRVVPDLTVPENLELWRKIEVAKHALFYSLMRWRLPLSDRSADPKAGLVFDLVSDVTRADGSIEHLTTGHDDGLITINIAEADDVVRESRRTGMGEPYRTLLGHFRHEIGHYYWDRLLRDNPERLASFRGLFGDETKSYADALKVHYEQGAPGDWQNAYISSYATAHPWEDFAETWAHYVHIVDALETVRAFGISIRSPIRMDVTVATVDQSAYEAMDVEELVTSWVPVTIAINSINRSMGQPDLYPFVLSQPVIEKLRFVHEVIHAADGQAFQMH